MSLVGLSLVSLFFKPLYYDDNAVIKFLLTTLSYVDNELLYVTYKIENIRMRWITCYSFAMFLNETKFTAINVIITSKKSH